MAISVQAMVGTAAIGIVGVLVAALVVHIVSIGSRMKATWKLFRNVNGSKGFIDSFSKFKEAKAEMHLVLRDMYTKYGNVFRMHFLHDVVAGVAEPEIVKRIWQTPNLPKSDFYRGVATFLGENLLTEDGDTWRSHRKLMQGGFMPQQLQGFTAIFQKHAEQLCDRLASEVRAKSTNVSDAAVGVRLRVDELIQDCTLDIIAAAGMRFDLGCLQGRNKELVGALNQVLAAITSPLVRLPFGPQIMRLKNRSALRAIDKAIYQCIEHGKKNMPVPGAAPRDLLDVLLCARDEHGEGLPLDIIRNNILLFFVAGNDTTAITLTFCLHELSQNAAVLKQAVAEVDSVVGTEVAGYEHVNRLPFVTSVLKETLRMHPPVVAATRRTPEDIQLDGDRVIPKGTMIAVCIDVIHHRADIYPEPYRFIPSRFTDEAIASRHPLSWIPFTQGPRICIGMNFFWIESRVLLSRLLQRFRIAPAPGFVLEETVTTGTAKPKHGLELMIALRA